MESELTRISEGLDRPRGSNARDPVPIENGNERWIDIKYVTTHRAWTIVLGCILAIASSTAAVEPGQVDDFEDGTVMDWSEGFISPNPPVNVPTGGPNGAGDTYLENTSDGGSLSGSRMVMFNIAQWTGNYNAFGIAPTITAHMANLGSNLLLMRVAVEGANGARYSSTDWNLIDPDAVWYEVEFEISESTMTLVEGSGSLGSTLDHVVELRILSSFTPSWRGDKVLAVLGADNITFAAAIFSDDFESGNTSAWSSTVP